MKVTQSIYSTPGTSSTLQKHANLKEAVKLSSKAEQLYGMLYQLIYKQESSANSCTHNICQHISQLAIARIVHSRTHYMTEQGRGIDQQPTHSP